MLKRRYEILLPLTFNDGQPVPGDAIEQTREARTGLVKSWYRAFLGRLAGGGEEQFWVIKLLGSPSVAPQSEEQVLSGILGTPEFYAHAQTLGFTGTADEQYIKALYLLLLNRAGSDPDVAFWASQGNWSRWDARQTWNGGG